MDLNSLFPFVLGAAVIWHVLVNILIYDALQKRNFKMNFLLWRLLAPKYASQYREITRKETGRTGPLFYHWIASINVALLAVILLFLG